MWTEDFAEPESVEQFRFQLHNPNISATDDTWQGDHNMACEAPTTNRDVHVHWDQGDNLRTDPGELVWWCGPGGPATGHLMTSMDTPGYGQVDFTPDRTFDQVDKVCWSQNMTDMGPRKWVQVVVIPEAHFQANGERLDYVAPWLQAGPGSRGVRIAGDDFLFEGTGGTARVHVGQNQLDTDFSDPFGVADKARRFKHCLIDQGNGTIRIEAERLTTTKVRILDGAIPDGPVRVIFQDDNYNPRKSGAESFTWHWDDLRVEFG